MNEQDAAMVIELALGDYAPIRDTYRTSLYAEILGYLSGDNLTARRNGALKAITNAFNEAGDQGYQDGGGTLDEPDEDYNDWLGTRLDVELYNMRNLFEQLRQTKKDPEFTRDEAFQIANTRSNGYAATLDSIYNESKMRGAKNKMLTFGGQDGHAPDFPCPECKRLKGKRHRAKWFVSRGLVPYPGNPNFTCGNWQCRHFLFDDTGKVFTV